MGTANSLITMEEAKNNQHPQDEPNPTAMAAIDWIRGKSTSCQCHQYPIIDMTAAYMQPKQHCLLQQLGLGLAFGLEESVVVEGQS